MEVVLAVQSGRHTATARALWPDFTAAVGGCPFEHTNAAPIVEDVLTGCDWPPQAVADATILRPRPTIPEERARICLANVFFDRTRDSQLRVLLHESIHVKLFVGRLETNYRAIEGARPQRPRDNDAFTASRWALATNFLMFVQEVGADLCLHASYPQFWDAYLTERLPAFYLPAQCAFDGVHEALRPYVAFYRLLRVQLGLKVVQDEPTRTLLEERAALLEDELGELPDEDRDRLTTTVADKFLGVDVGAQGADPEPYRELFDEVMQIPAPAN